MTSRADILARLPGVPPIAVTQSEAAALCGMSVKTFLGACKLVPAARGGRKYYPYDDVKSWFRAWWLAQSGRNLHADAVSDEDLLGRLDGQNAA